MCILLWCASLAFARYSRFSYQQLMHKSCGPPRSRISEAFGFRSVSAAAETRLDLDADGRAVHDLFWILSLSRAALELWLFAKRERPSRLLFKPVIGVPRAGEKVVPNSACVYVHIIGVQIVLHPALSYVIKIA